MWKVYELVDMIEFFLRTEHRNFTDHLNDYRNYSQWRKKHRRKDVSIESMVKYHSNNADCLGLNATMDKT